MWTFETIYDVIVIGAGHAGAEAAYISAKKKAKTLLLTINLDTIAKLSCNPSIGGSAKGHIVREIDALGGIMGKIADRTAIHWRMLNASKGPAVHAPRAQVDRVKYQNAMKEELEKMEHLEIKQATIEDLIVENKTVKGVISKEGIAYLGKTVIICSGTFMQGQIFIGTEVTFTGGRNGEKSSLGLSTSLKKLGFKIGKLKTGTPPRLHKRSIDLARLEEQPSELNVDAQAEQSLKKVQLQNQNHNKYQNIQFSFEPPKTSLPQVSCYISYTTEKTKAVILKNLKRSALFAGKIQGVGPRYCPSIEDKIVRFADKERHLAFLEPEGLNTAEFYVNGISSSMPFDVQLAVIHSMEGLEKAEIMRPAYAIEYDWVENGQILATLESKPITNLFFAGQPNGTTGYEEAAAQGLMAGINAANKVLNLPPFILERSEAYIGVMIDDLVTKEITEPYRMFTSRAEHRLLLRQDNADLRLFEKAFAHQTISSEQYEKLKSKKELIKKETSRFHKTFVQYAGKRSSLAQMLGRKEIQYENLITLFPDLVKDYGTIINNQIQIELKYEGYLSRQVKEIEKLSHLEKALLPIGFNFDAAVGLRNEAKEMLKKRRPPNLGAAARISGVSPADISVLLIILQKNRLEKSAKS